MLCGHPILVKCWMYSNITYFSWTHLSETLLYLEIMFSSAFTGEGRQYHYRLTPTKNHHSKNHLRCNTSPAKSVFSRRLNPQPSSFFKVQPTFVCTYLHIMVLRSRPTNLPRSARGAKFPKVAFRKGNIVPLCVQLILKPWVLQITQM